jgi:hypothetical protein
MAKKPKKSVVLRARERICKELLKRSPLMAPDPEPVSVVASKQSAMRARQRHAQLAMARIGADPRLV